MALNIPNQTKPCPVLSPLLRATVIAVLRSHQVIHDRGIRRRACERCHRQKLACRRNNNNNNESCLRCMRANVACVSGPMRSIYRATPSYMTVQQPVEPSPPTRNNADGQFSCWYNKRIDARDSCQRRGHRGTHQRCKGSCSSV
ncbi:hypothetical protein HDV64DRAFT_127163 [Trichoderma sp. TUCIM 5745]